ncbi:MAG: penicillin-binding protein 2 [Candidatus Pacebacteria bacterium]|nr:penicillin-binding protein 2 [Candidatus Paceibacterota bacterium]
MKIRFALIIFSFAFFYLILVFNLYTIQVKKGDLYTARAESQISSKDLIATRGSIYFSDKDGNFIPAAIEKKYYEIYAVPTEIDDVAEAAEILSPVFDIGKEELFRMLSKKNDKYELLKNKVSEEELSSFSEAENLKGIYKRAEPSRFYPLEKLGAHVLGYTSFDEKTSMLSGKYGVEAYFDELLSGENGGVEGDQTKRSVAGEDLFLTIDRNIQYQAEKILEKLVSDYKGKSGSVLVEDPKTGRILAMASFPNFDPNSYSKYPIENFLNPSVQSIYEPGSIFKIFTMAAGLDSGAVTPETTYYDSGEVKMNGRTIRNWDLKAHGTQTMTNVIEQSLNTGMVFVEKQIGHSKFLEYINTFGFDEKTGITLPGEVAGTFGSLEKNPQDINFATVSFGQGVSLTPIELLRGVSAIANGGILVKPTINARDGIKEEGVAVGGEAAKEITEMMISAVEKAQVAAISGYNVAGKTGTAQVPNFKKGGYTDQVINTYSGFAPAFNPRFVILIKLDEPAGAPLAGQTVVPAFRELAEFILNYYNIPPDKETEKR